MSIISIRLPNHLLDEVDVRAETLHVSRAEYIRKAIESMSRELLPQERKKQLTS